MDTLKRQVAVVRRRLSVQRFISLAIWCVFAALSAAALAVVIQKVFLAEVDGRVWAMSWIVGGLALALIAALVAVLAGRRRELDAAIELDHRFGLRERVSSALALSLEELQTPAGQALVADAVARVNRLDVATAFPVRLSRRAWAPLVPAALVFLLTFVADPTRQSPTTAQANPAIQPIKQSVKPLEKKAEAKRLEAEKKDLKDAARMLAKIERAARELNKEEKVDTKEALSKLNELAKQVEKRREALGDGEKLKQHLAQMKDIPNGPAGKIAQAIKKGDFDKALKELEKLKDQLSQGQLGADAQRELARQMEAMRDAMKKMADSHDKAQKKLEQQLEQARQAGDERTANKLEEQLQQLQQQMPQMNMLKDMASKLGQCAQCMNEGNSAGAQSALNGLAGQLSQLQREAQEMQMMDASLMEIAQAKSSMTCNKCGGGGCKACQGEGGGSGSAANRKSGNGKLRPAGGRGGLKPGIGRGGVGDPDPRPDDSKFYDSRVRPEVGRGTAVQTGEIAGPNAKGQALEAIKTDVEKARSEASDPLTGQKLPRAQRDHVKEYFDAFREGR